MVKNFRIQALQTKLSKQHDLCYSFHKFNMQLYLFGSAIDIDTPHDLDLLFFYRREKDNLQEVWKIRELTIKYILNEFNLPVDQVTLSFEEEKQIKFILSERAIQIKI